MNDEETVRIAPEDVGVVDEPRADAPEPAPEPEPTIDRGPHEVDTARTTHFFVSVDTGRVIRQHAHVVGEHATLGERDAHTVHELSADLYGRIVDMLGQQEGDGSVILADDMETLTLGEPSAEWLAAQEAGRAFRAQRAADLALIAAKAAEDAHFGALARVLGIGQ